MTKQHTTAITSLRSKGWLQRLLIAGTVSVGFALPAASECKLVPFDETPDVFVKDFETAMRRTGTSQWMPVAMTKKGPLFMSDGTDLKLTVSNSGGLVKQAAVVVLFGLKTSAADIVRLEAASAHFLSTFSGTVTPSDRAEIASNVSAITKDHKKRAIIRRNAAMIFETVDKEAIVVSGGRFQCD